MKRTATTSRTVPERLARTCALCLLVIGCGSQDHPDSQPREWAPGSAGGTSAEGAELDATVGQSGPSVGASGGTTAGEDDGSAAKPADPAQTGGDAAAEPAHTGGREAPDPPEAGGALSSDASDGRTNNAGTAGDPSSLPDAGHSVPTSGAFEPGTSGASGAQVGGAFEPGASGASGAQVGGAFEPGASGALGASGAAGVQHDAAGAGRAGSVQNGGAGAGGGGAGGNGSGPACTAETCGAHGVCTASGGTGPCQCASGYDGDYCERCAEGYELNAITHSCELPCPGTREIRCDGQCMDGTSARRCGSCDSDCGDALCVPSHGSWQCRCPYTLCDGVCRNTLTDENNCTNCGAVCPEGQRCFQGLCRTPATDEPPAGSCTREDELWCGEGACLESPSDGYDEDENNCGGCGRECSAEQICVAGTCQPASDRCWWPCDASRGELCCGEGACVDYLNDPHNCGRCGMNCASGESCVGGHCQCASPTARCGERANEPEHCYDLRFDNDNCGACGHECEIIVDERCVYGECVQGESGCGLDCGSSELCCPSAEPGAWPECVQVSTMASSPEHCGGCQPCPSGQICSDGVCGCSWPNASCPDPDDPDTTECVSLETAENCGECGFQCTGGRKCVAPSAAEQDARCGCPGALTWCSGFEACVDLGHDEQHCGSCANACAAGDKCIGHRCVAQDGDCGGHCTEDQACCSTGEGESSACTDVLDDVDHCGRCSTSCSVTYACSGGLCRASGDRCSAPAVLPPAQVYLYGSLSPFVDDGAYSTACGINEGDTEEGVEAFYVLEAPAEGATYDVSFFSDDGASISMGRAESSNDVCAAAYDTCLTSNPIHPDLSGPVVFMVSGPASATFELGLRPW